MALVQGALVATVHHWSKAKEVVGLPLMDAVARTLDMQLSILMGKVT